MTPEQQAALLSIGREVLSQQAFSTLLGAELLSLRPGHCELAVAVRDELKQQHGFVHGGVVSYLADNALTYAGGTAMRVPVVTAEFKINYLRPAKGDELVARAVTLHAGQNQAVCRCDVFVQDARGAARLCATAQGTISRRAASRTNPTATHA